jgi:manganese/zinc/iron transport system permease protein
MNLLHYNTLIVLGGTCLLGAVAGLVGTLAVLRRRALAGDAFAHAALPGLCIAFLIVGQRSLPALLIGAFVTGSLGLVTVALLRRYSRIKEDAALGIVLSVFFGAGAVLSRIIQNVVSGGNKAGLDNYILGKTAGMIAQDVVLIGGAAALCLVFILLLYKEFQIITFDADFGQSQGWPVVRLDFLLMGLLGLVVTLGLPAVGVVMMAALLILPAVAARFWTERLAVMMPLSCGMGVIMGAVGTWLSAEYANLPAGPAIVLVGTGLFLVSALLAPRRGLIARWFQARFLPLLPPEEPAYHLEAGFNPDRRDW